MYPLLKRGVCHTNVEHFQRAMQQFRMATVTIAATISQLQTHSAAKCAQTQMPLLMNHAFFGLSECHYSRQCHFRQVTMNSHR